MFDVWALCLQQQEFFERGPGKERFGQWQSLAVDASKNLVDDIQGIAKTVTGDEYDQVKSGVDEWVDANPIETVIFTRESTAPLTAAALGSVSAGAFAAVGNMADEVRDLSARISVYSELVPKQARWQAALLLTSESGGVSFIQLLQDIALHAERMEDIVAFLDSVEVVLDSMPALISAERTAVMNDITRERVAVMRDLNQMLAATLQAVDLERVAVMDGISAERIAALQDLDALAARLTEMTLEQAELRINDAIDHFYWRLIQVLAALAVLLAVGGFFAVRYLANRIGPIRT
jgi:hypothetical protein